MSEPTKQLSVLHIPDALKGLQDAINAAEATAEKHRAERDRLIIEAIASDIPYKTITKWTGLSRSNIVRIQAKPR